VEVDDPAGGPVVPALYPGGRLLAGCPARTMWRGLSAETQARSTSGGCRRWDRAGTPHGGGQALAPTIEWCRALDFCRGAGPE
jgi:hypothetical protein